MSFENPEGTDWHEIKLPDNLTALSISCSQNGSLWVVTCEDKVLVRTGIACDIPYGNDWTMIEPYPDATFIQITANLNLVYALDVQSNVFLLNVDEDFEWVKVLKDLSSISLSISNKVNFKIIKIRQNNVLHPNFFLNLKNRLKNYIKVSRLQFLLCISSQSKVILY